MSENSLKLSNIIFAKHKNNKLINDIKKILSDIFSEKTIHYSNLELNEYRKIVKNAQEILNEKISVERLQKILRMKFKLL